MGSIEDAIEARDLKKREEAEKHWDLLMRAAVWGLLGTVNRLTEEDWVQRGQNIYITDVSVFKESYGREQPVLHRGAQAIYPITYVEEESGYTVLGIWLGGAIRARLDSYREVVDLSVARFDLSLGMDASEDDRSAISELLSEMTRGRPDKTRRSILRSTCALRVPSIILVHSRR